MIDGLKNILDSKFGFMIKLLVSCSILFFFFFTIDYKKVAFIIAKVNYAYLILLFSLTILRNFTGAVRFHFLISVKKKIRVIELMKQYFIASFFNNFLPTAIGGDGARIILVSKFGIPKTTTALFIIIERLIGFFSLIFIAFISSFFWKVPHPIRILISVLTFGYASFMLIIFSQKLNRIFEKRIPRIFDKTIHAMQLLRKEKSIITATFMLSICYQLVSIMISYYVAVAIDLKIPVVSFLTLVPLVWFFTMIPISLGGVGLRELSFVYLLSLIGISREGSIIISLGTYFTLIISGIIGMMVLFNDRLKDLKTAETNNL